MNIIKTIKEFDGFTNRVMKEEENTKGLWGWLPEFYVSNNVPGVIWSVDPNDDSFPEILISTRFLRNLLSDETIYMRPKRDVIQLNADIEKVVMYLEKEIDPLYIARRGKAKALLRITNSSCLAHSSSDYIYHYNK